MVDAPLNRRAFIAGLAALGWVATGARAEALIELDWQDLVPEGQTVVPPSLQGFLDHDETALPTRQQPRSSGVRTDWNGRTVSLPGFIVPLDYSGTGVTAFILVPYVGACVHVPPPPANQLVFVTSATPYDNAGLFEAVTVVGQFTTAQTATELADISYTLSADMIRPYNG